MLRAQAGAGGAAVTDAALDYVFGARPEFLEAAYDRIAVSFGSFRRYLERGLGVAADMQALLRNRFLG